MEGSEGRASRNEALFRDANERIEARRRQLGMDDPTPYICECSHEDCTAIVRLEPAAYGAVRAHPRRYLQVPGHALPFERVVAERDGYVVVEKREDPRASDRGV